MTSILPDYATPPLRLLTEEEARFRSLEAVANGAPVEQKDQCLGRWWMGRETPWKINGWNLKMEVWKIIFLSKWVICRFHVNLPGWRCWESIPCLRLLGRDPFLGRLFREGLSHGELHLRMLGWIGNRPPRLEEKDFEEFCEQRTQAVPWTSSLSVVSWVAVLTSPQIGGRLEVGTSHLYNVTLEVGFCL